MENIRTVIHKLNTWDELLEALKVAYDVCDFDLHLDDEMRISAKAQICAAIARAEGVTP